MSFETRIREIRVQHGLTQRELAVAVGISREFISQIENKQKKPSIMTLIKLSKALNVIMSDLLN